MTDKAWFRRFPIPYATSTARWSSPKTWATTSPFGYNRNRPRKPEDITDTARRSLVVRDGFASSSTTPFSARPGCARS
jgi:hypothetical protein